MDGLRQNEVEIIECRDDSPGLKKYWNLWVKHRAIKNNYDFMIVGYPGHLVVPLAKIISKKPVIFDALCTLYEGEIISRGRFKFNPFGRAWILFVDWMAAKFADLILVETNAQKNYFLKKFSLLDNKVVRVFTGANEDVFYEDPAVKKHTNFTAVFRGRLLPEAGVEHVVRAAKILENERINFLIIGGGLLEEELQSVIEKVSPKNLVWIKDYLPDDEVRQRILECHVALGQMGKHERLERTIPHKAFETLSMALPYITARTVPIAELFTDRKNCLLVEPANSEDLAKKILELKNSPDLASALAKSGNELYEELLTPAILANEIITAAQKLHLRK